MKFKEVRKKKIGKSILAGILFLIVLIFIIYQIKETAKVSDGIVAVANILDSYKTVLLMQREILELADEGNDEGTNSLMSDYISLQEKDVWMYSSFMNH